MKKIILLIIILIVLISCQKDNNVPKIQIGTKALQIDFLSQAPPFEVHENETFNIFAEIKNIGTQNIDELQDSKGLLVVDVDDQYVRIKKEINPFFIEGKSLLNPVGGSMLLQKKATAKALPIQQERMNTKIIIGTCFKYSTNAGIDVCIDTIPEKLGKKVCTAQTKSIFGGQGAPVAITRIESKMLPSWDDKKTIPEFTIYLQNLGGGEIINKDKILLACDNNERNLIERKDFDLIDVKVSLPQQGELTCNNPSLSLQLNDRKVVCKYDTDGGIPKTKGVFLSSLAINIKYGYFQTAVKPITISKV